MAEQAQRKKKTRQCMAKSKTQNASQEKIIYLFNDSIYNNLPCDVEPCQEKK
jgi:hypothetical protein